MKRFPGDLLLLAAPFFVLGLTVSGAERKIYECKDAKGNVVYQDDPCIEPAPATPKAAAESKAASKPQAASKPRAASKLKAVARPDAAAKRPAEPAPPDHPVDARWATPEKTLRTFVGAVKAGDSALVLSCLTGSALAELGPDAASLPLDQLRETVDSFTAYVSEGDLGPFWSIRALRAGMRPKWIFFERTGYGEWKIGGI